LVLDPARNPHVIDGRHEDQMAPGKRDVTGNAGALGVDLVLHDLHQDLVAFLEHILDLGALAVPVALLATAAAAFRSLPGLAVLAAVSFRLLAGGAGSLSPAFAPASPPTPPPASFASRRALIGGKPARASVGHLGRGRCLGVPLRRPGGGPRRCTRRLPRLRPLG